MLKSSIVMLKVLTVLILLFQNPTVTLTSPQPGATLRGQVEIFGVMDVPNFSSAELAFSYLNGSASNPADSWFTIQTFPQPKTDSPLAIWDTTTVTDGDYTLHLRVYLQDGSSQDAAVADIKIRNDVVLPTETPTEVFQISTPIDENTAGTPSIVAIPTQTPFLIRPTAMPPNPASLSRDVITSTFLKGILIALAVVGFVSVLLRLRKNT